MNLRRFERLKPAGSGASSGPSARQQGSASSGLPSSTAGSPEQGGSPRAVTEQAPSALLELLDLAWFGSPALAAAAFSTKARAHGARGAGASSAAITAAGGTGGGWYVNRAATGSSPSLCGEDVLDALLPEALPPALGPAAGAACAWAPLAAVGAQCTPPRSPGAAACTGEGWNGYAPAGGASAWAMQPPSPPRASHAKAQAQPPAAAAAARQGIASALGTWIHRQFKLPLPPQASSRQRREQDKGGSAQAHPPLSEQQQGQDATQPRGQQQQHQQQQHAAGAQQVPASPARPVPAGGRPGGAPAAAVAAAAAAAGAGAAVDDDALARAAWRWRFARRWQAEQARVLDAAASGGDGDGLDEAIAYLAACGERHPWGELGRTASASDGLGASHGSAPRALLGTAGSGGLLQDHLLFGEGSVTLPPSYAGSPAPGAGPLPAPQAAALAAPPPHAPRPPPGPRAAAAARAVAGVGGGGGGGAGAPAAAELSAVTRRASQLLRAQSDLESAADARWREAQAPGGDAPWAGALLPPVEVDTWGRFPFVLARLRGGGGRAKLVVRGRNNTSEAALMSGLRRQVQDEASRHAVPAEAPELVGAGVMEWRRERDRTLQLHSGRAAPAGKGRAPAMSAGDVLQLAAVMTKQALPMHYKVAANGRDL